MSIERIEEYKQQNGVDILKVYCKPTKNFPEGQNYFYAPAEAIDLVRDKGWYINPHGKGVSVIAKKSDNGYKGIYYFHRELFYYYNGVDLEQDIFIDHINLVEYDNIDQNLNIVSRGENKRNTLTKGYTFANKYFRTVTHIDGISDYRFWAVREDEICRLQNICECDLRAEGIYIFNFFLCRRESKDILDLERTGQISEEEAIYRHVLRYADNPWYLLRYGLEVYCKENHIPIPAYSLDSYGFMVHPVSGVKLCPFAK